MKKIPSVILALFMIVSFSSCSSKPTKFITIRPGNSIGDSSAKDSGKKEESGGTLSADNIEYTMYMTAEEKLLVLFQNKNTESVPEFDVEITFYDADGGMISVVNDGHDAVLPGAKVVSVFNLPTDSNYAIIEPDSYDVSIKIKDVRLYENLTDYLEIESNPGKNGVVARFTNNADKTIEELEVVAVYFKNDEIAGTSEMEKYDIESGSYVTIEFSPPYDKNFRAAEYDDYEIIVNQAHNFGLF